MRIAASASSGSMPGAGALVSMSPSLPVPPPRRQPPCGRFRPSTDRWMPGVARRRQSPATLREPALEEAAFGAGGREPDRRAVALGRVGGPAGSPQQVGLGGGEQVVVAEPVGCREPVELGERELGLAAEAARDRPVQLHHRRRGRGEQGVVPRDDRRPVGRLGRARPRVDGLDLGLHAVRADRARRGRGQQREALCDLVGVPSRSVLLVERHEFAGDVDASRRSRVLQQEQREHGPRLVGVGEQLHDEPGEPDGLLLQVEPQQPVARRCEVALVVHEHEHGEHPAEALGQLRGLGHPVGDRRRGGSCASRARAAGPWSPRARRTPARSRRCRGRRPCGG